MPPLTVLAVYRARPENGDVGLNHYVLTVNILTAFFLTNQKSGNALTPLSSIFSVLGP